MTDGAGLFTALFVALYATLAVAAAGHALLTKKDSRSAWGWIAVCALFPVAGAVLYYLFGLDRIYWSARRAFGPVTVPSLASVSTADLPQDTGASRLEILELARIGGAMSGRPLVPGNTVRLLHNGDETYPAMLEAIAGARERVVLTTYIFESGEVGRRFADALAAAQARGVEVRVLIDGVGDLYYRPRGSRLLESHGVPVRRFLAPRLWPPMLHINLRNHRKLMVVDGAVAFAGGINIGDYHMARRRHGRTLDLHFRLEGPVARQLEQVFAHDWKFAAGEALPPPAPGAPPAAAGTAVCRVITDGPNDDIDRLVLVMIGALANAHQHVRIMTPYFVPTPELAAALQAAALRGVKVSLLLPARSNLPWVDWASRIAIEALLRQEVRVRWRPAPFAHSKMLLIDDYYAQIGSANLDPRSFHLNFELMVEVYDGGLAADLARHFDDVWNASRDVSLAELERAPLPVRLRDAFFWLFSPYL